MNPRVSPRHPAARFAGADLARTAGFLARRGERRAGDGPHRSVAVALQTVRGRQRRSVHAFAVAYGLAEDDVRRTEAGWVAWPEVSTVLRILTPLDRIRRDVEAQVSASASASPRAQR
jgi:hypothetical protein